MDLRSNTDCVTTSLRKPISFGKKIPTLKILNKIQMKPVSMERAFDYHSEDIYTFRIGFLDPKKSSFYYIFYLVKLIYSSSFFWEFWFFIWWLLILNKYHAVFTRDWGGEKMALIHTYSSLLLISIFKAPDLWYVIELRHG